ncbi:DsbE family thiol:disulfide interchange protein [Burkholderia singularis]|uniref:DsbE family thiol:disulfide interchange protein n=1 Tax=Burkholderia singularis TaxID=1503053 RepID=UPI000B76E67B|nr:DsbE family thiol:disulfide interchange protein [Burkholderia singularis]
MKSLRFLLPLVVFAILAGFLWRGLRLDPHEVPSPLIDKPAPRFVLTRLDDPSALVRRDDMLGRVWMLNVWASWCVACREEHPTLVAFSRTGAVPIIGLNYKDKRADGVGWLSRFGNPYEASAFDQDGHVGIDFGVYGVPETFIIDKRGVIRFKQTGPLTAQVINERVLPLLRQLNG